MGDVTSGGVQDDAAANADISGGGGGDTSPSTPASLGFGGARGDIVARDTTPAPNVQPSRIAFNNQPISGDFFVNRLSRGLQDMGRNIFGGGTQTDDRGSPGADVGAVSVDDNQFNQGLASLSGTRAFSPMSDFPSYMSSPRADTDTDTTMAALQRGAPALMASNAAEEAVQTAVAQPKFMFDYGFGDAGSPQIDDRPRPDPNEIKNKGIIEPLRTVPVGGGDPLLFQDSRIMGMSPGAMGGRAPSYGMSPGAMGGLAPDEREPITVTTPTAKPSVIDTLARPDANAEAAKLAALARSGSGAKTQEELNLLQRLGRFLKGVGKSISNFEMSDIFEFLRGDPNFKGTPSSAIDPFAQQGMGPGPFVGGGVPSPSGGGGMPMPAKDPCPPGFRFDPTLQQCVPIIAPNTPTDITTTPTTPTTPAPGTSPPVAGGIANAYPFTLTPPIGTPVGNLPPVRLTT